MTTKSPGAQRSRTLWRLLVATVVTAVGLGLLPGAAPALAQTAPVPQTRSTASFCQDVPATNPFPDVSDTNTFAAQIRCLAAAEITQGQADGTYGPRQTVRRDQMATFVARMIDRAKALDVDGSLKALPAYDDTNRFTDTPDDSVHTPAINRLAAAGIVAGGPGGRPATEYGPGLDVTRAQMASFINRAIGHLTGDKLSSTSNYFTDLDRVPSDMRGDINGIASEGIATGPGDGRYLPSGTVRRDAMSAFLVRPLAYLEAEGEIRPVDAFPEASDGPVNGTGAAAQADDNAGAEVRTTSKGTGSFTACDITTTAVHADTVDSDRCFTYRYATGDTFTVDGEASDLAGFVAELSPVDDVTGTYARDGASTFSLRNEAPVPPATVTLEGTGSNRVTVTIAPSATPSVDAYEVQRSAPAPLLNSCSAPIGLTFTEVGEQPASTSGDTVFVDTTVEPETSYCYRVFAIDDGDVSTESTTAGPVETPSVSVAGAPRSMAVELGQGSTGSANRIDGGDSIAIAFNEAMAAPDSGDAVLVKDGDTNAQISCGSTNCTLNGAAQSVRGTTYGPNQVITIALTGTPVLVSGADTGIDVGATIYDERGFTDLESTRWDIDRSPALAIAAFTPAGPISTSVTFTNGGFASMLDVGDVIRLEFDQAMGPPDDGDSFTVRASTASGDGTEITCGPLGNATCALAEDTTAITVTITSSTLLVPLPAQITTQGSTNPTDSGYQSAEGVAWDLCRSTDLTVNTTEDTGDAGTIGCPAA